MKDNIYIEKKYKDFEIFAETEEELYLAERVIDKNYIVITEYKNTVRNYVAKIEIDGKNYILKSPKSETVIPQRRIQTFFKKGEALNSFYNIKEARREGFKEFVDIICVAIKRGVFIEESYILMECIEGENIRTTEDIDKIIELIKKIHKKGIYHGDLNTSNFIKTGNEIRIIDTQAKREKYWWFKRGYDILTLKEDLLVKQLRYSVEKRYKIKKGIGYSIASLLKKFKRNSVINKIREIKVKLRNKGWKI